MVTVIIMTTESPTNPRAVKCSKCFYEWTTISKLGQVSCPSCNGKVKILENLTREKKNGD